MEYESVLASGLKIMGEDLLNLQTSFGFTVMTAKFDGMLYSSGSCKSVVQ